MQRRASQLQLWVSLTKHTNFTPCHIWKSSRSSLHLWPLNLVILPTKCLLPTAAANVTFKGKQPEARRASLQASWQTAHQSCQNDQVEDSGRRCVTFNNTFKVSSVTNRSTEPWQAVSLSSELWWSEDLPHQDTVSTQTDQSGWTVFWKC